MNIIGKIKKLLQLADTQRNSNIEEAAAAAAKAQKLMEKHRIHKAMLEEDVSVNTKPLIDNGRPENWKLYLASVLAKHSGSYIVKSENYQTDNKIYLAGEAQDIESIQHLYTYIVTELNRLCLTELMIINSTSGLRPLPAFVASFYIGAITIIDQKLKEATQQVRDSEMQRAILPEEKLVIAGALQKLDIRSDKAKEWVQNNLKAEIKTVAIANTDIHGYSAGQKAAEKLDLHRNPKLEQHD